MKDREEFLASVYAKRDAELARKKQYKKRVVSGLSAAAACLVLTVGLVQMDILDFMDSAEHIGVDGAAMEGMVESGNTAAGEDIDGDVNADFREDLVIPEGAIVPDSSDILPDDTQTDSCYEVPGQASPPQDAMQKDIYDLENSDTNDDGLAYYCLPRFSIEQFGDGCASMTHGGSIEDAEKVKVWLEGLAENGQLLMEEPDSLEGISCIVTIETEPQQKEVYYLTGEVGWYE